MVMGSIVVGIWALIVGSGFMNGFMESHMADVINHDVSNFQVHNPDFKKDYDIKYYFVTINSGQLENDHYPIYEFLIENNRIVKKQKYFYDVAGIEGAEYSLLAPIAETAVLILSIILLGIYKLIFKLRKNWLQ